MGKLKKYFGAQDMTKGSPLSCLLQFALPLLIGNFGQQLYNTVDSIVVGRYVGDAALAAVGVSMPIVNLIIVLFVGISTGIGIMVSQYFGAQKREELSNSVGTSLVLCAIVGAILTVVGPIISRYLIELLKTPADVAGMATTYLTIVMYGVLGQAAFNIVSGILRGLGDSIMSLVFLLVASVLNIGLDIWFVAGFGWGVMGVAVATVIAQAVSGILCCVRLVTMKNVLDINKKTLRLNGKLAMQLVKLGIPAGVTQAIMSLSMVIVQSLTNKFGTLIIAVSTVVMRVDGFAMLPNFTFGIAMTTFTGQNIGARRMDRVEKGAKTGTILSVGVACTLTLCLLLFGRYLMAMFTQTEEVIAMGNKALRILAAGYIAVGVTQSLSGVMRGAGDTMTPMWISMITTVAVRLPLAYLLAYLTRGPGYPVGRPETLFVSLLLCWILGAAISLFFYRRGGWRSRGLVNSFGEE